METGTRNVRITDQRWEALRTEGARLGSDRSKILNALVQAVMDGEIMLEKPAGRVRVTQPAAADQPG
jgi:hypothetical protein